MIWRRWNGEVIHVTAEAPRAAPWFPWTIRSAVLTKLFVSPHRFHPDVVTVATYWFPEAEPGFDPPPHLHFRRTETLPFPGGPAR
jgi:hypothetical protein